jgi:hypothetical protein
MRGTALAPYIRKMPLLRGSSWAIRRSTELPRGPLDGAESLSEDDSAVPGDTGGAGERIDAHEALLTATRVHAAALFA